MGKVNKTQATLLIIIAFGFAMIVFQQYGVSSRERQTVGTDSDRAKGNPQAAVKVVEFMDFQCPACAHGAQMLSRYYQDYSNEMHIQVKYFPLSSHEHAVLVAQYAECAAHQKKFWPVHDLLFERQSQWKQLHNPRPDFDRIASEATVDLNKLKKCLDDPNVRQTINADKLEGEAKGVKSTPTYFVNGNMVVGSRALKGALDYSLQNQSP